MNKWKWDFITYKVSKGILWNFPARGLPSPEQRNPPNNAFLNGLSENLAACKSHTIFPACMNLHTIISSFECLFSQQPVFAIKSNSNRIFLQKTPFMFCWACIKAICMWANKAKKRAFYELRRNGFEYRNVFKHGIAFIITRFYC